MRVIEQEMIKALETGTRLNKQNTKVYTFGGDYDLLERRTHVHLHGHLIAKIYPDRVVINNHGHPTRTTCDRLQVVLSMFCSARVNLSYGSMILSVHCSIPGARRIWFGLNDNEEFTVPRTDVESVRSIFELNSNEPQ